jgi:gentisate 1,2-dioxygenase
MIKSFPRGLNHQITGWTLEHHLDNQAARLILEKKGASGWINGDRTTLSASIR